MLWKDPGQHPPLPLLPQSTFSLPQPDSSPNIKSESNPNDFRRLPEETHLLLQDVSSNYRSNGSLKTAVQSGRETSQYLHASVLDTLLMEGTNNQQSVHTRSRVKDVFIKSDQGTQKLDLNGGAERIHITAVGSSQFIDAFAPITLFQNYATSSQQYIHAFMNGIKNYQLQGRDNSTKLDCSTSNTIQQVQLAGEENQTRYRFNNRDSKLSLLIQGSNNTVEASSNRQYMNSRNENHVFVEGDKNKTLLSLQGDIWIKKAEESLTKVEGTEGVQRVLLEGRPEEWQVMASNKDQVLLRGSQLVQLSDVEALVFSEDCSSEAWKEEQLWQDMPSTGEAPTPLNPRP